MSKKDLLLEIGLEEVPARFILDAADQLSSKVKELLESHHIEFGAIHSFSTPRRLAVLVEDVNEKQNDLHEEVKGPAKKIAMDENGNWTKAAVGFTKGQGKTVDDIYFKDIKGVEYVFVKKHIEGRPTKEVLKNLNQVITGISFPINMRWKDYDLRYIRPIRWLVALFGAEVIDLEITGVKSGNVTYGHRFLGGKITIDKPEDYREKLKSDFVIADYEERRSKITEQIKQLEKEHQWSVPVDPALLEEVTNLVEYPTVLYGSFDEKYLQLPKDVLITTMKEHQRYFPVEDQKGNILNYFITVRNGNAHALDIVRRGNEKVIRARLQDAVFFYEEDQKLSIDENLDRLYKVVYHDEIGSYEEKINRIQSLTRYVLSQLPFSEEVKSDALRAAQICKFDLVTQMVNEFPELQGIMGEEYARIAGEKDTVAKAINEHYMPKHAEGELPESDAGAVVSIADKLDTIASFFAINMIPSGSQDPYGLRRQATGIVKILLSKNWKINFSDLLQQSIAGTESFRKRNAEEIFNDLLEFFKLRFKYILSEHEIRYDIIDAVLEAPVRDVNSLLEKALLLNRKKEEEHFKEDMEALSRVMNIAKKFAQTPEINPKLFENDTETKLYEEYKKLADALKNQPAADVYYERMVQLKEPINAYFDNTMVMVENEKVRNNRLSLLKALADIFERFAHFPTILVK